MFSCVLSSKTGFWIQLVTKFIGCCSLFSLLARMENVFFDFTLYTFLLFRVIHFVVSKLNVNKTQIKNIFSWYFIFIVKFECWKYVWTNITLKWPKCCKHCFFEVIFNHFLTHIRRYLSHNLTNAGWRFICINTVFRVAPDPGGHLISPRREIPRPGNVSSNKIHIRSSCVAYSTV